MVKKQLLVVLSVLMTFFLVNSANALSLNPGETWGHLSDWTAIETTRGDAAGDVNNDGFIGFNETWNPIGGEGIDIGIAIARMDSFYDADTGDADWTSSQSEQLTILQYNLVYEGFDALGNYYFESTGTGNNVDIYLDDLDNGSVTPFDADQGLAGAWTYSGGVAQYPGLNDDDLWLSGVYAPLFQDTNLNGKRDPTEALIDIDNDGNYSIYTVTFTGIIGAGVGSAHGYVDFTGGDFLPYIEPAFLGSWSGGEYDMSLQVDLSPSRYGDPFAWQTRSSDPTYFNVVPEPGTFFLLGLGLLSIAGFCRKK